MFELSTEQRIVIARDFQLLEAGAGFRRLDNRLIVRVSGDDRVSFMHGMCTADVKALQPGQITPALFATDRAHVIANCFIYCQPDVLWIEIERSLWPQTRAHLERLLVADDVEMDELEAFSIVDIEGVAAAKAVSILDANNSLAPWHSKPDGMIARLPRFGLDAFTLITDQGERAGQLARFAAADIRELSDMTLDVIRVEQGMARIGVDTNDKTLALEANFRREISFDKGCYLGQETLERATARGGIKRRLYGLRIESDEVPPSGANLMLDGKSVGSLTSAVWSPHFGVIGLGVVHHSAWTEGAHVVIDHPTANSSAQITDLPFKKR